MKKTLVYLLAYGRSGSTILDWLMDCHPHILGLGEIGRLPSSLLQGARIPSHCACGDKLDLCEFWKPILAYGRNCKATELAFESWNSYLLSKVLEKKPGATILLDSSGHLHRLNQICNSAIAKNYTIKILYLTRDSRGVIYSASIRGYNMGEVKPSIFRASLSWWIRNHQMLMFLKKIPKNKYIHINYENLCSHPEKTMNNIHKFLSINEMGFCNEWKLIKHHTFAGNRRLRESGKTKLSIDRKWDKGLKKFDRMIVESITGRLNKKLLAGLQPYS